MIDFSQAVAVLRPYDQSFDDAYASSAQYLKDTDWQVIAMYERQRQMPEDVWRNRQQALDVVTSV
ncbi:hypothetical protein [uncultured Sphingomonas sp.]|uniref:hypothetical protein n=1 Tax=uncultured Sphingomonas sp. TaxID=158754 RepID=UPI00259172DF|nr:hypothetical protein [uncultured Sphingomonas sp.]